MFPSCPVRNVLSRIGNRWSLLVLLTLQEHQQSMRFSELSRAIPDVSQKMLTSTLRELEADDLVARKAWAVIPPRVEYSLTHRAGTLLPLLNQLVEWSLDNLSDIVKSRERHLKNTGREADKR